jgi:hypothetical protein
MTKFETRCVRVAVVPEGEPIFSDRGFTVSIEDEAAGEFLVLRSHHECDERGMVAIDLEAWSALRNSIEEMWKKCRAN